MIPYIALILAISGIILGASVLSVSKFGDTMPKCENTSSTYNPVNDSCENASGTVFGEKTIEFQSTLDANTGQLTIAEQLPTVAIISIMVIIISVIAGVFVYLRYFS